MLKIGRGRGVTNENNPFWWSGESGKRSLPMDQEINQPIEVMAVFEKGKMLPVRFRWNGRVVKIVHITARWRTNEGRFRKKHYSVMNQNSEFFQLTYKERTSEWFLNRIWVE
jgi:hypothetical protein